MSAEPAGSSRGQLRLNQLFAYIGRPPKPVREDPAFLAEDQHRPSRTEVGTESAILSLSQNQNDRCLHETQADLRSSDLPQSYQTTLDGGKSKEQYPVQTGKQCLDERDDQSTNNPSFLPHGRGHRLAERSKMCERSYMTGNMLFSGGRPRAPVKQFCLFPLLAKLPYKYLDDPEGVVARGFFTGGKFYRRTWTLYSWHAPLRVGGRTLILVPLDEAAVFIEEIAKEHNLELHIPPFPFTVPFYDDGTPQPTYLGQFTDREDLHKLEREICPPPRDYGEAPSDACSGVKKCFDIWKEKFVIAQASTKSKGSRNSSTREWQSLNIADQITQLEHAQYYLGLLSDGKGAVPSVVNTTSSDNSDEKTGALSCLVQPHAQTSVRPDIEGVIFVCIDVEADERDHSIITEIGVSTLDAANCKDLAPGIHSEAWSSLIQSRHFRIQGTEHIRNTRWCQGDPNAFEFGTTEWLAANEAAEQIDSFFEWPPSTHKDSDMESPAHHTIDRATTATNLAFEQQQQQQQCHTQRDKKIVLVGHNIGADIEYLSKLGSKVFSNAHKFSNPKDDSSPLIHNYLDTATIDQAVHRQPPTQSHPQPRSLAKVCNALGITTWNLHNAGNDARYTLEAMIKLAVKGRPGDT